MYTLIFSSLLFLSAYADIAIDTPDQTNPLTKAQFDCFCPIYPVFTAHIFNSDGSVNQVGVQNLATSSNAVCDFGEIQVFISPCPTGKSCKNNFNSANDQAAFISNLLSNDSSIPIYIEVQTIDGWSTDKKTNQKFITDLANAFTSMQYSVGIKTNYNNWSKIMGNTFTFMSNYGLWWVNWNNEADLTTGWTSFGGWTQPIAHQYTLNVTTDKCAQGILINYSYFQPDYKKMKDVNPKFKKF